MLLYTVIVTLKVFIINAVSLLRISLDQIEISNFQLGLLHAGTERDLVKTHPTGAQFSLFSYISRQTAACISKQDLVWTHRPANGDRTSDSFSLSKSGVM